MTDQPGSTGSGSTGSGTPGGEPIGSVGEELLRLVSGAQDWLRHNFELAGDRPADQTTPDQTTPAQTAAGQATAAHATVCGWCPLCQFVAVLRGDRPELSDKVAQAGTAVASAFRALIEASSEAATGTAGTGAHRADRSEHADRADAAPRVQRIDLSGDDRTDPQ